MISLKFKGLDEALRDLKTLRTKAIPHAIRNGLNDAAFEARRIWQGEIKRSFTLRNQYTVRSIQVERAKGTDMRRMAAFVGSTAPYMRLQELGGTRRGKSGKLAIPGPVAAGQAPGSKRTRMIRGAYRLGRIQVPRLKRFTSRGQRNAVAIAMAKRRGQRFALLDRPKGGKGLFLVGGGKRKATTKLLYDVSRGSVQVSAVPTLTRTLHRMNARMPRIMLNSVLREIRQAHLFGR